MEYRKPVPLSESKYLQHFGVAFVACLSTVSATAAEIDTGNPDFRLRWDNTVKYVAGYRLHDADSKLASDANLGDGDTNFRKSGLISNRIDLLSELEGNYKQFGFRISGAGWYDTVYNRDNDNNTAGAFGPGTSAVNSSQISKSSEFTPYTRDANGRDAELLDAFVSQRFDVDGHAANVRVGQFSQVWGESLFFGDNAVAGAMSPIDVAKAVAVPNLRFQEILRPVPQVSGQYQLSDDVTAYSYYQLQWREDRSQGSGSYFSPIDFQRGGNLIYTPTGPYARSSTQDGKDSGQFGVALRIRTDATDYGLYALRFNSKASQIVTDPINQSFYEAYHSGTNVFGASANHNVGLFNLAVESSVRFNQDLLSPNAYDIGNGAEYAVGKTWHVNLSAVGSNLGRTMFWDDAQLLAEAAFTRVLSVEKNADTLSGCQPSTFPGSVCKPNGTRDSWKLQALFEPVYYQAFPGIDVRLPFGISYQPSGSRNMVGAAPLPENAGTVNLGVSATYLDTWRLSLNVTHFFGSEGVLFSPVSAGGTQAWNYEQYFGDRDYATLVLSRTF
ncbi:DUF1302 family protein [Pseudomonas sp.]|uniref:DUF1302 domain-containing protein n=1 Tax=Pseudomonas sp. TaxID=306 RepID=UPI00261BBC8A|nr:DUF1302 family protein [Pseudomonas sp.]